MRHLNPYAHTTHRYRGEGIDLFFGVLVNCGTALFNFLFHLAHAYFFKAPSAPGKNGDLCTVMAIGTTVLLLSIASLRNPSRSCSDSPEDNPPAPAHRSWIDANGMGFMLVMLSQTAFITWIASDLRFIQIILFVAFWTTAFTYLPILGFIRVVLRYRKSRDPERGILRDVIGAYFRIYGYMWVFPLSVVFHAAILAGIFLGSFSNIASAIINQVIGGSLMVGFFISLPLHGIYERLIFGRNISTDPELIRKRAIRKAAEAIIEDEEHRAENPDPRLR